MKKTCFAYIRVSTVKQGQQGSSLQEQHDAIAAFAQRANLSIVQWFEDRETAAKKGRTEFMRMMAALEKGNAGCVIFHKIDRGARNFWDWARIQDLIDQGVAVHFAHDNLDLKSRGGRLAADIQAVVAADYIRNLREEVQKGFRGRLKQGLYPLPAPVGYLNCGKARAKAIDPVKGPLVKAAFELYATKRYSLYTLAQELHRRGLSRKSGKALSLSSMAHILHNPFYIGVMRLRKSGEVFQGVHAPIIDSRTFNAVQAIIEGKANVRVRGTGYLYRRLLRCGSCGYSLTAERQRSHIYYRCHTRTCAGSSIREEAVTASLLDAVGTLAFSPEVICALEPWLKKWNAGWQVEQPRLAERQRLRIAALMEREHRLTDAYLDRAIDRETFNSRKSSLLLELTEAKEELRHIDRSQSVLATRTERFFEHLKSLSMGPTSESAPHFRDAIEFLTSNISLVGKKLNVAMRSPFRELSDDLALQFGAPHRGLLRTTKKKECDPRRVAQIIVTHLRAAEEWPDSETHTPMREPLPHWFGYKEPPEARA